MDHQKRVICVSQTFWHLILATFLFFAAGAKAGVFFVTDTNDSTNVTSLRGAIIAANATGGGNIIVLTNDTYHLSIQGIDEDGSYTGDLDITNGDLIIMGLSSSNVTIDATGMGDRVFEVFTNAQLTLSDLVITGGAAPGDFYPIVEDSEPGGAIYNLGTLTLENCIVSNNASGPGSYLLGNGGGTGGAMGGGICNAGFLTLANCTITGNSTGGGLDGAPGGDGGGIYNFNECELINCIVAGNIAADGGPQAGNANGFGGSGGNGGGIYNAGFLTLSGSMVSSNYSGDGAPGGATQPFPISAGGVAGNGGDGGGIFNSGQLTLTQTTINGNLCGSGGTGVLPDYSDISAVPGTGGGGGAIYNLGSVSGVNCTVYGNDCGAGGDGGDLGNGASGGGGGGLFNSGSTRLTAWTIASNSTGPGGNGGTNATDTDIDAPTSPAAGGPGGNGGGIWNTGVGVVTIDNCLIARNSMNVGGLAGTNVLYFYDSAASMFETETIQPGTAGPNGIGPDISGDIASQGFNLIGRADGSAGLTNGVQNDLAGGVANPVNPLLGALQANGGLTWTCALLPGSPAIDAGDDSIMIPREITLTDQRGDTRFFGAHTDIGAFEYNGILNGKVLAPMLTSLVVVNGYARFWFNGATGLSYSVWATADFKTWTNVGSAEEQSRGWFSFGDSSPTNSSVFYQVRYP